MAGDSTMNRKSLMVDGDTYARLSILAKCAGTPRQLIVRALLDDLDETKVVARAKEFRLAHLANNAELRGKQATLMSLTSGLSAAELGQLLQRLRMVQPTECIPASEGAENYFQNGESSTVSNEG